MVKYTSMLVDQMLNIPSRESNQPINRWIYTVLWANIIELRLKPGQAISETEASELLGASRTPVREAFIRLAKDGLLEVQPQKGSIVSKIDLNQAREARFVRSAVEKEIMKEACDRFPQQLIGELESLIEVQYLWLRGKNRAEFLIADNNFHRIIYKGCGKEGVWAYVKQLDFNYDRLRIMTLPFVTERVIEEHHQIFEAIRKRNAVSIDAVIEKHLTWEVIDRVISDFPAEYFTEKRGRSALYIG